MDRTSDARLRLFGGRVATARPPGSAGLRTSARRRMATAHIVDRLTVHALSCALHAELDQRAAIGALLDIAAGNRGAVVRALRRIDPPGRPGTPAAQRAALFLTVALREGAWSWSGASTASGTAGATSRG
jgi:hypothetical protein